MALPIDHRIISTTNILPWKSENQISEFTKKIQLTSCDLSLYFLDYIQKGLLFSKPKNPLNFVQHLKTSLSKSLAIFYPLSGRIARVENDNETVSFFVDCDSVGAMFVHAVADGVTVADVSEPINVPDHIVYSFFQLNGIANFEGVSNPLLAVQVTELVDGLFIALSINHMVFDGNSFWRFFNTWSRISRESDGVYNNYFNPGLAIGENRPMRITSYLTEFAKTVHVNLPLRQRVFHFSKGKISQLKARANAEMSTDKISSLQALLANLWVSITRNRNLNPKEEVTYGVAVGLRARMQPPLPDEYLGNSVVFGDVKTTVGELLERGVGWAALRINAMIASWTEEEIKKVFVEWEKRPSLKTKSMFTPTFLFTGSSPRFDVYGNDFGRGKPLAVRSGAGNKFDGKLTVFQGADEGSVDFEACLCAATLEGLARDQEFLQTLGT